MQIVFDIPDEKFQRVIDAIKELFPIPKNGNDTPLYTDEEWVKEKLRRILVELVYQSELKVARVTARELIEKDDSIVT